MPKYKYVATDPSGGTVRGVVDAASAIRARNDLLARDLMVLNVQERKSFTQIEITAKKIDIGQPVTPETEIVVSYFAPVKPGQSIRLRLSETYTAPESYRLDGSDLVFERGLGRTRNSVVLPAGWYLTASSLPAVVRETEDGRIRLDFVNHRPDSLDVYIKGRKRPSR